jgi:hypothetical protein
VLAPETVYATEASEWLRALLSSPRPVGSCPKPVPLSTPALPPPRESLEAAAVEISDSDATLQNGQVVISGGVQNLGLTEVGNVRVLATGFGLTGREVARGATVLEGNLGSDEIRDFTLKLGINPPVIWVRLQILEYEGRRPNDPLHAVAIPLLMEDYEPLARARIKIAASIQPLEIARAHTVCLRISDAGGFPVQTARIRLTLNGSASGTTLQQLIFADVTATDGGVVQVNWSNAVRVTPQVEVVSVQFAP